MSKGGERLESKAGLTTKKGIPTTYRNQQFRSRLEARWAVFFDGLGWAWEYEPFDMPGYIPDFVIQGNKPMLVDVKPSSSAADFSHRAIELQFLLKGKTDWTHDVLLLGVSPLPDVSGADWVHWDDPVLGMLIEIGGSGWSDWPPTDGPPTWIEGGARWATCLECERIGVHHDLESYAMRPCGHYKGDHHLGPVNLLALQTYWREADRLTRWNPR